MTTLWISLNSDELTSAQVAAIQELVPHMTLAIGRDPAAAGLNPADVEIATGWFGAGDILSMPSLRWAQHWAAGVDSFAGNTEIVAKDFLLTKGSGIHAIPIAEHILGLLLTFARSLHTAIRQQENHIWRNPGNLTDAGVFELAGKTMLLIGVGAIGARTAEVSAALGMRVIGLRRDPTQSTPAVAHMVGPDDLLDVLPEADFIVLTVPLTPATRGIVGERELRAMKPTAIIVNIGRGGTIQEEVLIRALREGWIAGAGLDVVETTPLPADSPLWELDNVIITSHYAGNTPKYSDRAIALFLDNLRRYLNGDPLRNIVDMQHGY